MKKIIIAAVAENGIIGKEDGTLPWHIKEEFQHFKSTTLNHPIIMGRKTFNSLGKPLKGRLNIVVTRDLNFKSEFDEVKIFSDLMEAINFCEEQNFEKTFIIVGGEIYKQAIEFVDEMILSIIKISAEGSVKFPDYNLEDWEIMNEDEKEKFTIKYFQRRNKI